MDSLAPARSALTGLWLRQIPFAGGLLRFRSVGLSAFAAGKSFSPLPKWLKSQTAQVQSISLAVAPKAFGATLGNRPHKFINAESFRGCIQSAAI